MISILKVYSAREEIRANLLNKLMKEYDLCFPILTQSDLCKLLYDICRLDYKLVPSKVTQEYIYIDTKFLVIL